MENMNYLEKIYLFLKEILEINLKIEQKLPNRQNTFPFDVTSI